MTIVIFQREIVYIGSIKTHFLLGRKKRQIPIFFFFEQKDFFAQFVHSSDSLSSVWHTLKCYSVDWVDFSSKCTCVRATSYNLDLKIDMSSFLTWSHQCFSKVSLPFLKMLHFLNVRCALENIRTVPMKHSSRNSRSFSSYQRSLYELYKHLSCFEAKPLCSIFPLKIGTTTTKFFASGSLVPLLTFTVEENWHNWTINDCFTHDLFGFW